MTPIAVYFEQARFAFQTKKVKHFHPGTICECLQRSARPKLVVRACTSIEAAQIP